MRHSCKHKIETHFRTMNKRDRILMVADALNETGMLTLPAGQNIIASIDSEDAAPAVECAISALEKFCVGASHLRVHFVMSVARRNFPHLFK